MTADAVRLETKQGILPFSLVCLCPYLLLVFTLALSPNLIFASMVFLGVIALWRYGLLGLASLTGLLLFAKIFTKGSFWFDLGWITSVCLGLYGAYLSLEEILETQTVERESLLARSATLEREHSDLKKAQEKELTELNDRVDEQLKKVGNLSEDILSLRRLVDTSRLEADSLYKVNEALKDTQVVQHQELTSLRQKVAQEKSYLKELNELRVTNFQLKTLLESAETKVEVKEEEDLTTLLQTKENEKKELKLKLDDMNSAGVDPDVLKETKRELVALERELFGIKKKMRDQGTLFR